MAHWSARHGRGRNVPDRERAPSRVAQERLSEALRDRAVAYRQDATVDLTMVEALLRLDDPEAAAKTLDDHRASLHAMARDLQVAVADAAVEREAERVWEACADEMAPSAGDEYGGLRRRVLAMTGAAAVALVLLLPAVRLSPRTVLTSMEDQSSLSEVAAARERLEAARTWARALRAEQVTLAQAQPRAVSPQSPAVVDKVRSILAADASGGSAASGGTATDGTVVNLDEERTKRRNGGSGAAAATAPPAEEPPEEVIDLEELEKSLPGADSPLNMDTPDDPEDLQRAIERAADSDDESAER